MKKEGSTHRKVKGMATKFQSCPVFLRFQPTDKVEAANKKPEPVQSDCFASTVTQRDDNGGQHIYLSTIGQSLVLFLGSDNNKASEKWMAKKKSIGRDKVEPNIADSVQQDREIVVGHVLHKIVTV